MLKYLNRGRTFAVELGDFKVDRTLDLKGEVCPLTFVRAKLAIEKLAIGEVLGVEQTGEAEWRLFVRKDRRKSRS